MEKSTGILLLIAVAFRLLVLFFFSQSIFLTQLSISTFIVVIHCHYTVDKEMASLAKLEIKSITAIYSLS